MEAIRKMECMHNKLLARSTTSAGRGISDHGLKPLRDLPGHLERAFVDTGLIEQRKNISTREAPLASV
jgi:hypothetical protein